MCKSFLSEKHDKETKPNTPLCYLFQKKDQNCFSMALMRGNCSQANTFKRPQKGYTLTPQDLTEVEEVLVTGLNFLSFYFLLMLNQRPHGGFREFFCWGILRNARGFTFFVWSLLKNMGKQTKEKANINTSQKNHPQAKLEVSWETIKKQKKEGMGEKKEKVKKVCFPKEKGDGKLTRKNSL